MKQLFRNRFSTINQKAQSTDWAFLFKAKLNNVQLLKQLKIMEKRPEVETLEMFIQRNINKWSVTAVKFNKGNINILQYAYYTHIRAKQSKNQILPVPITNWFMQFGQKQLFSLPLVVEPFQTSMFML